MPSELQRQLAALCGIDVDGLSERSAAAALQVGLAESVLNIVGGHPTSESQREIALQLGLSGLSKFKEIAGLQIQAEFVRRNEKAFAKYRFAPGMRVKFIGGPNVHGLSLIVGDEFELSTVKRDGRIYLKATNGAAVYASQLVPIS